MERCYCRPFSCEETVSRKPNGELEYDTNQRFRFVKDNGVITDQIMIRGKIERSGLIDGGIKDCPMRKNLIKIGVNVLKKPKYR